MLRKKTNDSKSLVRKVPIKRRPTEQDRAKRHGSVHEETPSSESETTKHRNVFEISPDGEVGTTGNVKSIIETLNKNPAFAVNKLRVPTKEVNKNLKDDTAKDSGGVPGSCVTTDIDILKSKFDNVPEEELKKDKYLSSNVTAHTHKLDIPERFKSNQTFTPKVPPKPGTKPVLRTNIKTAPKISPKPKIAIKPVEQMTESPFVSGIKPDRFESVRSNDSGFCSVGSSDTLLTARLSKCSSIEDLDDMEKVEDVSENDRRILSKYMESGEGTLEEFCEKVTSNKGIYFQMHSSGSRVKLHQGYVLPDKSEEDHKNKLVGISGLRSLFETKTAHESEPDSIEYLPPCPETDQDGEIYYNRTDDQSEQEPSDDDNVYEPVEFAPNRDVKGKKQLSIPEIMRKESAGENVEDLDIYDDCEWYDWSEFDESDEDYVQIVETDVQSSIRRKDKLYCIAEEILTTEKRYIAKLELLVEAKLQTESIVKDSSKKLFPYIDGILKLHREDFLPQLQKRLDNWEYDREIGDIMKRFAPFLKMYTDYVKNFNSASNLVKSWMEKSAEFDKVVKRVCNTFAEKHSLIKLDIESHMLEPIQRVPRYKLLLLDYLKHLPDDCNEIERRNVEGAVKLVSEAAEHFELTISQKSEFGDLMELDKQIDGPISLMCAHRKLIKQGYINKYCVRRDKLDQRYLFLFNDLLMVCKESVIPGTAKYKARQCLHTEGMQILEGSKLDLPHTFLVKTKQKTIQFVAEKEEDKMEWQQALWKTVGENMLEKLNKKNRYSVKTVKATVANISELTEDKLGKVAPLWIKNKEASMCMICATPFGTFVRRHHCRACGILVCSKCSSHEMALEYDDFRVHRVCDECFAILTQKPNERRKTSKLKKRSRELSTIYGFLQIYDGRSWMKRFCEIHEGGLFFIFKASQDLKPLLSKDLGRCSLTTEYHSMSAPVVLCLGDRNKVKYLLRDDNEEVLLRWKEAFNKAIEEAVNTRYIGDACLHQPERDYVFVDNEEITPKSDNSKQLHIQEHDVSENFTKTDDVTKVKQNKRLQLIQEDSMNVSMDEEFFNEFDNEDGENSMPGNTGNEDTDNNEPGNNNTDNDNDNNCFDELETETNNILSFSDGGTIVINESTA